MMTDFEQAVVDHHQHSIPNNLLDCPAPPILQESGACITPKNEEEKEKIRMEEEDLINRCNNTFNIPLPSRFAHVYPPEPATASPGTMAPVVDTTMNNKNSTMTVKLEQQKIDSLLLKLRETKAKRRELEKKTESLMEQISFHQSEGRKLENWHACRMVAWKAITNGKMHLAKSTTLENDECTQSEMMDLKATVTDDRSNFSTWKIEEEALKCYLKQESEYSIIRRDLIDEFSRSCDNEDFAKYDDLIQLSPSLPQRVRTKVGWLVACAIAFVILFFGFFFFSCTEMRNQSINIHALLVCRSS